MKRLFALLALAGAVTLTACDDPRPAEPEVMQAPTEEPVAAAVEAVQVPVVASDAVDPAPDASAAPTDKRTSEESVQPNSETLFY